MPDDFLGLDVERDSSGRITDLAVSGPDGTIHSLVVTLLASLELAVEVRDASGQKTRTIAHLALLLDALFDDWGDEATARLERSTFTRLMRRAHPYMLAQLATMDNPESDDPADWSDTGQEFGPIYFDHNWSPLIGPNPSTPA